MSLRRVSARRSGRHACASYASPDRRLDSGFDWTRGCRQSAIPPSRSPRPNTSPAKPAAAVATAPRRGSRIVPRDDGRDHADGALATHPLDVALIDVRLPRTSGHQLARAIRSDQRLASWSRRPCAARGVLRRTARGSGRSRTARPRACTRAAPPASCSSVERSARGRSGPLGASPRARFERRPRAARGARRT